METDTLRQRRVRSERSVQRTLDDLRRIFRRVEALSRRVERVTGLTGPEVWALKALGETGSADVAALARRMRLHPATLTGVLERLAKKELVEWRRPRRAGGPRRVALTAEGEYIGSRAPAVAQELLLEGLRRLSPEGLSCISAATRRLVLLLGAKGTPAQLLFSEEVNLPPERRSPRVPPVNR